MSRKAIFILGGLLVLILAIGGFLLFGGSKTPTGTGDQNQTDNQNTDNSNNDSGNSGTVTQKVVKISDTKAVSPAFSYTGNSLWYFTPDGHLYEINLISGLKKEYVLPSNLTVSKAIWPMAGDDFILVTDTDAAGRTFNYYSAEKKAFVQYPKNIRGVDFTKDGKQVVYNWVTDKNLSGLTLANPDTSAHQSLLDLPDGDYDVKVSPLGDKVFIYQYKNPGNSKIGLVDLATKKLSNIDAGANNAVVWSTDGKKFAYNKPSIGTPGDELWIGDISSSNADVNTGLKATADKVFFDATGANMYVAADQAIWKVSIADNKKTKVLESSGSITISPKQILISKDTKVAYIWNSDGYLYRAELTQ